VGQERMEGGGGISERDCILNGGNRSASCFGGSQAVPTCPSSIRNVDRG
jgi:hypothetical protein